MEGTGWYKVYYEMAENYYWAKNSGCGIFSGQCTNNPMTCGVAGNKMCSYDYYAQGKCRKDSYAEACPIFSEVSKGDCRYISNRDKTSNLSASTYYGIGSKCVMSKIGAGSKVQFSEYPNCLKAKCLGPNRVQIEVEGKTVLCTKSGEMKNY